MYEPAGLGGVGSVMPSDSSFSSIMVLSFARLDFIYSYNMSCKTESMDKKSHGEELKKELDILISRISALEASSTDKEKKSLMGILKVLAENQKHFVDEFEHLKKALDLMMVQIFKMDQAKNRP